MQLMARAMQLYGTDGRLYAVAPDGGIEVYGWSGDGTVYLIETVRDLA